MRSSKEKEGTPFFIIDTIITCERRETIHLTLDTTLPRGYYSRNISLRGTRAMTSEKSILKNGAPVDVPDFTHGMWQHREPIVESKYCLDKVCVVPEVKIIHEGDHV